MSPFKLQFDITFQDLHSPQGLQCLDELFQGFLQDNNQELYQRYKEARNTQMEDSDLILAVAPLVEDFLAHLFDIEKDVQTLQKKHHSLAPLHTCKRTFIQRQVAKKANEAEARSHDGECLRTSLEAYFKKPFDDLTYATHVLEWLQDSDSFAKPLQLAKDYGVWTLFTKAGQTFHKDSPLFDIPQKRDLNHLIPEKIQTHQRDGFGLTDKGLSREKALDQANYCLYCHERKKDSCATGLPQKEPLSSNSHRDLEGCPLEEKISEMNLLKSQGLSLAALCVVTIDNPLVAATGHRICNDCSAACIFQKQDPVDIPGVETQNLKDVLSLPWGFEIYALLTRWNPLRFESPLPKESTGGRALIVGMGPSGFTLAHYLLQEGHTVVGVDGLKIEPLPRHLIEEPIKESSLLFEDLDQRIIGGFGGVAEYGITVRWDKNFLTLIRLLLERRDSFCLHGGVRFGSTITPDQALKGVKEGAEFDHVALCAGAGQPNLIPLKNALARGVRQASDFLMALQLTGAAKKSSLANLELRLPAVVIGGGLTAIDSATEALAYYPTQVEKFLSRHEKLGGDLSILSLTPEQEEVAQTWITHAKILREERKNSSPDILKHLQAWGGVTVLYRKTLQNAPSYRLNHEEVFQALQEGIQFTGEMQPTEVCLDDFGHAKSLVALDKEGQEEHIPASSIFIAAGTKPNITLSKEYPDLFELDGIYYKAQDTENVLITLSTSPYSMSYFGDLHPTYKGSVVKAMASAKYGYKTLSKTLKPRKESQKPFLDFISGQFRATLHQVNRLTPTTLELVVHAPLAVKNFKPGQFYRLQNFETSAQHILDTTLALEGIALTGAWVDREQGLISLIILEMGGASSLCQLLKIGEEVVLMGPTGAPTEIPHKETICLMGGGLGNAVLFSIGQALKEAGNHVVYLAAYRKSEDVFYADKISTAAHQVIWVCEDSGILATTPQDKVVKGTILDALKTLDLKTFDRFIAIGSASMMGAVKGHLTTSHLKESAQLIASINAPMQCMMKEICAQCLQRHVDPATGLEFYIYTCATQDQNMKSVDFSHLHQRLQQNSLQEKMTALWIKKCMQTLENKAS
ncbi:MAG TPA: pyridine nucleotide-disulfide oxidoreductase [Holosporales bacterium]|nr:pyridine nucleotide-disulfide oxidoreductase [Holosporales bacterium]